MHFVTALNVSILFKFLAEKQIRSSYEQGRFCTLVTKIFFKIFRLKQKEDMNLLRERRKPPPKKSDAKKMRSGKEKPKKRDE